MPYWGISPPRRTCPGLARLDLLAVDWYRDKHVLQSFFSVPVGPYDPEQRLFGCHGELPSEGLPMITEIPVASFAVRRFIGAVIREDHIVFVEGVSPSIWHTIP